MTTHHLTIPISEETIRSLYIGDTVHLSGVIVTARDTAHKYMVETLIESESIPESERSLHEELKRLLDGGIIYHCGPVVRRIPPSPARLRRVGASPPHPSTPLRTSAGGNEEGQGGWQFVAAGPTTSIREEPYEPGVIAHFGLRGIIGKGGMGPRTLHACREHDAVYFHAVGGAASLIAKAVKKVIAVYKLEEFGAPEALWIIRVDEFPVIVTMDSHGQSIHDQIEAASRTSLERLLSLDL
jgi:fumarate hydratase class I